MNPLVSFIYDRLSPKARAQFDWRFRPRRHDPLGGPLNGQPGRRAMVEGLLAAFRPHAVIETGSYFGSTTAFLAERVTCPVVSLELNEQFAEFTRLRVARHAHATVRVTDSVSGLAGLAADVDQPRDKVFFYLDAHWEEHLPLAGEIGVILGAFRDAVMVIDDFQVVDDPDYTYDDYGPARDLTLPYVARAVDDSPLAIFLPSLPGAQEGGRKRGCAVIATGPSGAAACAGLPDLRLWGDDRTLRELA